MEKIAGDRILFDRTTLQQEKWKKKNNAPGDQVVKRIYMFQKLANTEEFNFQISVNYFERNGLVWYCMTGF